MTETVPPPWLSPPGDSSKLVAIKMPLPVKTEQKGCILCFKQSSDEWYDLFWTETRQKRLSLVAYLCRLCDLKTPENQNSDGTVVCNVCLDLINELEQIELEYFRLKENVLTIVTTSRYFENGVDETKQDYALTAVKQEVLPVESESLLVQRDRNSSDDEPLVLHKKRGRKPGKKNKKYEVAITNMVVKKEENDNPSKLRSASDEEFADDVGWDATDDFSDNDYEPLTKVSKKKKQSLSQLNRLHNNDKEVSIKVLNSIATGKTEVVKNNKSKARYPCTECNAVYRSLARYTVHLKKHEASKAPFICEICGASYKHKKACDVHVALHKGISDWKCEECNKLFPSKGALRRHNDIHSGKPNYQCDLCGKSFIHTSSFKMHKLSHSGVKPHKCDVCGLALMTRSHLKRHARIHSGEKRHECTLCGKRFSERYNLLVHQKSHDPACLAVKTSRKEVTWRGFRCHFCDKRFERRYLLERHTQVEHQCIIERGPAKPRNTMAKLLKAQAAAGAGGGAVAAAGEAAGGGAGGTEVQATQTEEELEQEANDSGEEGADVKPVLSDKSTVIEKDEGATPPPRSGRSTSAGGSYEIVRIQLSHPWSSNM